MGQLGEQLGGLIGPALVEFMQEHEDLSVEITKVYTIVKPITYTFFKHFRWVDLSAGRPRVGDGPLARLPKDLVGLGLPLPFFCALPVAQVLVDPRQEAAGERLAEACYGKVGLAQRFGEDAVDVADRTRRIVEERKACLLHASTRPQSDSVEPCRGLRSQA